MLKTLLLGILLTLTSSFAQAHPLDLGYLQLKEGGDGTFQASFELNPKAAENFSGLQNVTQTSFSPGDSAQIFRATLGNTTITDSGAQCIWESGRTEWMNDQQMRVTAQLSCPPGQSKVQSTIQATSKSSAEKNALQLGLLFLKAGPSTYQVLGRVLSGEHERSFVADPKDVEVQIQGFNSSNGSSHSLLDFIGMGIKHIGATPSEWHGSEGFHLPDGIDHILFLLALILAGGGLIGILKAATGFTVGHSVTLAIASLGLLRLPSRLVESAIALSIVYVAIEALLIQKARHRWKVAAGFGLVHGFGFASALGELKLSSSQMLKALFGFNFGVETGQALIIVGVLPVLVLIEKRPELSRRFIQCCSGLIAVAGSYWFFQRAFG